MILGVAKLEEFFEAKFEGYGEPQGGVRDMFHFDGFFTWHLMLFESSRMLRITASKEISLTPVVEIEVRYSNSNIQESSLMQGGLVLIIRPQGCVTGSQLVVFSKNMDGRISISTSVGDHPSDESNALSSDWFENEGP